MTQVLSCPAPTDINPLSPNGFMLQIIKLPQLTYFCQEAQIPSVSLPTANQATPMVYIGFKGEQLQYQDLNVQFLIDSKMENYKALNLWMTDNFPDDRFDDVESSNGYLHVLDAYNKPVQTIEFSNMLPINLSAVTFTTRTNDVQYLVGNVTFRYTYYQFK